MENNKLGQEPAFPLTEYKYTGDGVHEWVSEYGMSKRFYAACAAMQGISTLESRQNFDIKEDVRLAYQYADELLKQENL